VTSHRPRVVRSTNEPPAWEPLEDPGRDYAFDLIPQGWARIRLERLDGDVAAKVLAAAASDDPAVAIPAAPGSAEGIVTIRVGDQAFRLGRLPAGYEVYYTAAVDRGLDVIPLEAWPTEQGPVIDVAMGRTPEYGDSSVSTLTTSSLRLRLLTDADVPALLSYRGDADVCRYLPFPPMDEAEISRRLETQWARTTLDEDGQGVTLGVVRRDTGKLVGDVVIILRSREHGVGEIGWVFSPSVAGRGFATEAANVMLSLAFRNFGLRRVIARLDERNDASARLCERLGMRLEARLVENEVFKGELTTELDYAILSREWAAQQAQPTSTSLD
jgi:RimJ/RimL family protein N-acetyltransferase